MAAARARGPRARGQSGDRGVRTTTGCSARGSRPTGARAAAAFGRTVLGTPGSRGDARRPGDGRGGCPRRRPTLRPPGRSFRDRTVRGALLPPCSFFRVCGRLLLKSTVLPNLVANSHLQNHALRLPFRAAGLGAPRLRRAPGRAPGLPQAPALRASGPRVPWLRTRSPLARVSVTAGRTGLPVGAAWKAPQGFEAPGSPAPSCPVIGRGEDSSPGFGQ